jgi:pimeloyl-ACP methyl ester carboxylesterase
MRRLVVVAATALLAAGCGGGPAPVTERAYGSGADKVWVFTTAGAPRSVVVFLHGLDGISETTPVHHLAWLRHLAERGNAVVYPRFEALPGAPLGLAHAVRGTLTGLKRLGRPDVPLVLIGYSRGGGLAVNLAAVAERVDVRPRAVLAVFPAERETPIDLTGIPLETRIVLLVGDRDEIVGTSGRDMIVARLREINFPLDQVSTEVVRSTSDFAATHLSVLDDSPGARQAFWERADRLIDELTR